MVRNYRRLRGRVLLLFHFLCFYFCLQGCGKSSSVSLLKQRIPILEIYSFEDILPTRPWFSSSFLIMDYTGWSPLSLPPVDSAHTHTKKKKGRRRKEYIHIGFVCFFSWRDVQDTFKAVGKRREMVQCFWGEDVGWEVVLRTFCCPELIWNVCNDNLKLVNWRRIFVSTIVTYGSRWFLEMKSLFYFTQTEWGRENHTRLCWPC